MNLEKLRSSIYFYPFGEFEIIGNYTKVQCLISKMEIISCFLYVCKNQTPSTMHISLRRCLLV